MTARFAHSWHLLETEHECDAVERKEFVGEEKPDVVTGSGPILAHMQLTSLFLPCCVHHQLFRCAVVIAKSYVLIDHRTGVVRKHYPNWKGYLRQTATGLLTVSLLLSTQLAFIRIAHFCSPNSTSF